MNHRRLKECGLFAYHPQKKPLLGQQKKEKWLFWTTTTAKKNIFWETKTKLDTIIFSNESKFNLRGSEGIWYYRRRNIETFHKECMPLTEKVSRKPNGVRMSIKRWDWKTKTCWWKCKWIGFVDILEECLKPNI